MILRVGVGQILYMKILRRRRSLAAKGARYNQDGRDDHIDEDTH